MQLQTSAIMGFRLSPQQARLWRLQQDNLPYCALCAIRLDGTLNSQILYAAVQWLVKRHEILRTTFHRRPGIKLPIQAVSQQGTFAWAEIDLSDRSATEQSVQLEEYIQQAKQESFDFGQSPLLKVTLLKLTSNQHILLLNLPALCADALTLQNLVNELSAVYRDRVQGRTLQVSDDLVQYVQFSEWQHELLEAEDADSKAAKAYWSKLDWQRLSVTTLPSEHPVTASTPFQPQVHRMTLSDSQIQRSSASVADFLLTCWQVLLWRLTGKQEVVVGVACGDRKYDELQPACGLFSQYLPVFNSLKSDQSFESVLQQTRNSRQTTQQWQEYFAWNSSDETTFLPFCFDYNEFANVVTDVGLTVSLEQQWICSDRFKLKLCCRKQNDALTVELQYDERIFNVDTVRRFAANLQTLIASALDTPNTPIGQLDILSSQERQTLLVELNPTPTELASADCIHHLIEAQAARVPDAIAVVCEDQHLTYAQLNGRANQLAHYLQAQGVEPDTPVALYLERSCNLLVGLLGILKAGGAYLPIDPALPTEAIHLRLRDAQVPLVVTQQSLVANLLSDTPAICLDRDWEATIAQHDAANPVSAVTPEHLVYVIYTSGSTGQPKGVAVEHRHLYYYLHNIQPQLKLSDQASYALVSTIAADLGNTIIFSALCTGGCLHVISQDRATHPDTFAEYCQQHQIDCLKLVPSHLNALLSSAVNPVHVLPRQCLVLGGEALSWRLIERVRQLAPTCRILNHYGPTEATVGVLTYEVESEPTTEVSTKVGTVPLGRPLANTQIYLLDDHQQLVPISVAGELYIGGASVARGYLNQAELTAERFVPHLFESSACLYRTGDLARYRADGVIDFLGRLDHQVKLHGYRIELGEIEAVLRQHPDVQDTVVVLREENLGQPRLVAYVVRFPDEQNSGHASLQKFLSQRLPQYMLPAVIVPLKTLPLTANGKIDRQSLPIPEMVCPAANFVSAQTAIEKTLVQIWQAVLSLKQISIHDNFFALGGDSILSIQVIARANQAGLHLTPKQLFEHQTIAELASVAQPARSLSAEQEIVTGIVPLTPIQCWFLEQDFSKSNHWNQAVLLECQQQIDPNLLEQTVQQLLAHHDALRLKLVRTETGWQQELTSLNATTLVSHIHLSELPEIDQQAAIETTANELQASLDLASGSPIKVALFDLGTQRSQRLLIIIHHWVVDGVSWRILLEDFQTVYQQLSQKKVVQLPAKTTSFKQWATRLQTYARSPQLQEELSFWLTMLQQPNAAIPVELLNGENTVASAHTIAVELGEVETNILLQDVPSVYHTQINDVLLTALVQAFHPWIGKATLFLDLEGHGREELFPDVNLSRTVGWFTSVFPVRLELPSTDPATALKAVKEQLRQIPNRGIGYGLLRYLASTETVEALQFASRRFEGVRSAKSIELLPQPQVKFNYLGQFEQDFSASTLLTTAHESYGSLRSPKARRTCLFEIIGWVSAGKLRLEWTYSRNLHQDTTVERLAANFMAALRSLIAHCQCDQAGGYTPSDFAGFQWSNWSQSDLDDIMNAIGEG